MKFGIAKLPKTCYKSTEKRLNAKKNNNNKEVSSIEDRKEHTNFCYGGRKSFFIRQIQCRYYGGPGGPYPPSWFTKSTFFGTSRKVKKADNVAKRNYNIQSYLID